MIALFMSIIISYNSFWKRFTSFYKESFTHFTFFFLFCLKVITLRFSKPYTYAWPKMSAGNRISAFSILLPGQLDQLIGDIRVIQDRKWHRWLRKVADGHSTQWRSGRGDAQGNGRGHCWFPGCHGNKEQRVPETHHWSARYPHASSRQRPSVFGQGTETNLTIDFIN